MVKAYIVSGVKNGKQKAWAFPSERQAFKKYDSEKFKRGWRDLGISETPSYEEAKKQAEFAHNSTPA